MNRRARAKYNTRMTGLDTRVREFFDGYERSNADVHRIAACYADVFMFGGPADVQPVKREDFVKVLPRRKEFFRSAGLVSSKIASLEVSKLDSKYVLAKSFGGCVSGATEPTLSRVTIPRCTSFRQVTTVLRLFSRLITKIWRRGFRSCGSSRRKFANPMSSRLEQHRSLSACITCVFIALFGTPLHAQSVPALRNAPGLRLLVANENNPTLAIILPGHSDSDRKSR